jgi:glycosyltransferase involved in cell wall biosynthesis
MDILYVGPDSGTSRHRARALQRLGHRVDVVDPRAYIARSSWLARWTWWTGGLFLEDALRRQVLDKLGRREWALALVDSGELVGPELVRELKRRCRIVVNYNADDPYGRRDGPRWRLYLRAVPEYDLVVVVREVNVAEAYVRGARRVLRVYRSADEEAHAPRALTRVDRKRWSRDVVFVGTWMPERGVLMRDLIRDGVPLSIYGDGWQKAAEWTEVRQAWRGPSIYGDDYVKAIRGAKACLGLLSKGNRDLHTNRTMEIPFAGGVLCAERTSEHRALYREGEEAVFWSDARECAERCRELIAGDIRGAAIAHNGRRRCVANGHLNERVMEKMLCEALRS